MYQDMIDKEVFIRSNMSGVWCGKLIAHADDFSWVQLENGEHLYRWQTNKGVTVAGLAANGINRTTSTVDPAVPLAVIRDIIEIIPAV
jgi:hypothetical protein